MKQINVLLTALILLSFIACSSDDESSDPTSPTGETNQKYTVSGKVLDQDGDPVSGATVNAIDNSSVEISPAGSVTTGADGAFSFSLDSGTSYTIKVYYSDSLIPDDTKIVSTLNSNQTLSFTLTVAKARTVSGTVKDVDGNPIENITVKLSVRTSSLNDVEKEIKTDASGYYEILNDVKNYSSWSLEVVSDQLSFSANESTNGFIMEQNITINFQQKEDYIRTWKANASGIPDSALSRTNSAVLIIDQDILIWFEYDSNNDLVNSYSSTNYTVNKSVSGNIHEISIPVIDGDGNLVYDYKGIFSLEKTQPKWTLKFEIVDMLVEGNTAPTVSGGFGSSNGGANGDAYVWTFLEQ